MSILSGILRNKKLYGKKVCLYERFGVEIITEAVLQLEAAGEEVLQNSFSVKPEGISVSGATKSCISLVALVDYPAARA